MSGHTFLTLVSQLLILDSL